MATRLTDKILKSLPRPEHGNRITYDDEPRGFGCRVTAAGARAFVLNYRRKADGLPDPVQKRIAAFQAAPYDGGRERFLRDWYELRD